MKYEINTTLSGKVYADSIEYNDEWMGTSSVTATIKSPVPIKWSIGDYIMYRGDKFFIAVPPSEAKQGTKNAVGNAFVYENVKFVGYEYELTDCEFRDVVLNDSSKHFTSLLEWNDYFNDVTEFADRIHANLKRLYTGASAWTVRVRVGDSYYIAGTSTHPTSGVEGKKNISLSFTEETVWDSLSHVKEDFDLNFIIRGRVITIGSVGTSLSKYLSYGKGNGLTKIERTTDESQAIITRLRAYGNTTNVPNKFYQKVGVDCFAVFDGNNKHKFGYDEQSSTENKRIVFSTNIAFCDIMSFSEAFDLFGNEEFVAQSNYCYFFPTLTSGCFRVYDSNYCTTTNLQCGDVTATDIPLHFVRSSKGTTGILFFFKTTDTTHSSMMSLMSALEQIFVSSGVDRNYWPVEWLTACESNIPDNLNVKNLMLRGFAEDKVYGLDHYIEDIYTDTETYSIAFNYLSGLGYDTIEKLRADFDFSTDPLDPWIQSKNASSLGIKEGSVTFDGTIEDYDDIYPSLQYVGSSNTIVSADTIEDNGVFDGNQTINPFQIQVDLDFNPRDYISYGKTGFKIHMQDGFCGGRDFDVTGVTHVSNKRYNLTLQRSKDSSLDVYFPYNSGSGNAFQIMAGDTFVITDIDMPDEYVLITAMNALVPSAIKYLKNNCTASYTYSLSIDPVQMQRFCDEQTASNETTIHDSIKAGDIINFTDTDLSIYGSITIDKLTIKEGDGLPKYEITLSEDKIVGNIQRMQNQLAYVSGTLSASASMTPDAVRAIVEEVGDSRYMRSDTDTGTTGSVQIGRSLKSTGYNTSVNGWQIANDGDAELESLKLRHFLEVPELRYNRTTIRTGVVWQTFGGGIIESVVVDKSGDTILNTGTITLKLEQGEAGAVEVGDLCMGIWHNLDPTENQDEDTDSKTGNFSFAGFMTVYFKVTSIVNSGDHSKFTYSLRSDSGFWSGCHPQVGMSFACYANDDATKTTRKSSQYSTTEYTILLKDMDSWTYDGSNIVYIQGKLDGFSIPASRLKSDGTWESYSQSLSGNGICFGNAYMFGNIEQFNRSMTVKSKVAYYLGESMTPEEMHDEWSIDKETIISYMSATPVDTTEWDYVYQSWKTTYSNNYVEWSEPQCIVQKGVDGTSPMIVTADYDSVVIPTTNGAVSSGAVNRTISFYAYRGDTPLTISSISCTIDNYNGSITLTQSGNKVTVNPVIGQSWGVDKTLNATVVCVVDGTNVSFTRRINITGSAQGQTVTGPQGTSLSSIVEQFQATATNDASTLISNKWVNTHIDPTTQKQYVWNRELITYYNPSSGAYSTQTTDAHLCCTWSDGIVSHQSWYCISTTDEAPEDDDFRIYEDDVQSAIDDMDDTWRYLWNWEVTTYKDTSKNTDVKRLLCVNGAKGAKGDKGDKGDTGTKGDKGDTGLSGCIMRMMGVWSSSVLYVNQSNSTSIGLRYIDVVQHEESGVLYYYYRNTATGYYKGAEPSQNSPYWTRANMTGFIASDIIIAKNILAERMQGSSFWATDSDGDVVAGVQSVSNNTTPMIFAGDDKNSASTADFRVYSDGKVVAKNAEIEGTIKADKGVFSGMLKRSKTTINSTNYEEYVSSYDEFGDYIFDFEKLGNLVEFTSNAPDSSWYFIAPSVYENNSLTLSEVEKIREMIGSSIVVINRSNTPVAFTGFISTSESSPVAVSQSLNKNQIAMLECKLGFVNGKEVVYWLFKKGNCNK